MASRPSSLGAPTIPRSTRDSSCSGVSAITKGRRTRRT
jgi:hypothetical protein